jgi:hypothetical protein
MDPQTVDRIASALRLDPDARRRLDPVAELLPEPDAWATVTTGSEAAVLLLAGEALFTVGRDASDPRFVVTCHRAEVTEVTCRRGERSSSWRFRFRDREPLAIEGEEAEGFALALAARAGWHLDGRPVARPEPARAEPPPATPAHDPRGRRGEPVTDVWGNPLSRRKKG